MSEELTARLIAGLSVVRPEGPGPFPVVVQLHGCGGVQPLQARYAQAACAAGVAAVIVDSLAPRGIGRAAAHLTVCSGLTLRGGERADDLVTVLRWLQDQPWADARRVAAAGWSHGGWAIMEALVPGPGGAPRDPVLRDLRLVMLVYPYAGVLSRTRRTGWGACRPRVCAWLAGRDMVVGALGARRALRRLSDDGLDVEALTLVDATHAFDDAHASDPRTRYRPDLSAQMLEQYAATLTLGVARAFD